MIDPRKHAYSLFDEFKAFALKGNVIDMAVGVIIGGAFGKIVASLVGDIIMPLIGCIMPGDKGYEGWAYTVTGPTGISKSIPYGHFIGEVVNFLIIALALFIVIVKVLGFFMKAKKEEAVAPPPPTKDQELLMEIRDLLKSHAA